MISLKSRDLKPIRIGVHSKNTRKNTWVPRTTLLLQLRRPASERELIPRVTRAKRYQTFNGRTKINRRVLFCSIIPPWSTMTLSIIERTHLSAILETTISTKIIIIIMMMMMTASMVILSSIIHAPNHQNNITMNIFHSPIGIINNNYHHLIHAGFCTCQARARMHA